VFIELAEALDCPVCGDGYGLVAFVAEADRRRVISGHLGCPMCEIEFSIDGGTVDFRAAPPPEDAAVSAATDRGAEEGSSVALKLAALLGVGERPGMVILLGAGLGHHASVIARMADRVEVIAVVDRAAEDGSGSGTVIGWDIDDLAAGVDPVVGLGEHWPLRSGALDGVALRGGIDAGLGQVQRCLGVGRRLVVVDPVPSDLERLAGAGYETLAADPETWVGSRA